MYSVVLVLVFSRSSEEDTVLCCWCSNFVGEVWETLENSTLQCYWLRALLAII